MDTDNQELKTWNRRYTQMNADIGGGPEGIGKRNHRWTRMITDSQKPKTETENVEPQIHADERR